MAGGWADGRRYMPVRASEAFEQELLRPPMSSRSLAKGGRIGVYKEKRMPSWRAFGSYIFPRPKIVLSGLLHLCAKDRVFMTAT